jgi:uncharacterized OsmC-like protein
MDGFAWELRVRSTGRDRSTAYVRQHRVEIGAPLSFDARDEQVSALEYVLAAVGADLVNGLGAIARRRRIPIDGIEAVVRGRLNNPLTYLGVVGEEGHPGLELITVRVYVATDEDGEGLRLAWEELLRASPLVNTLRPSVQLELSLREIP